MGFLPVLGGGRGGGGQAQLFWLPCNIDIIFRDCLAKIYNFRIVSNIEIEHFVRLENVGGYKSQVIK